MGLGSPKMPDQFNWIALVDTLAQGDITKYSLIYELTYEECMYKLLYDHHRDKYTRELNKRQELQNRR